MFATLSFGHKSFFSALSHTRNFVDVLILGVAWFKLSEGEVCLGRESDNSTNVRMTRKSNLRPQLEKSNYVCSEK